MPMVLEPGQEYHLIELSSLVQLREAAIDEDVEGPQFAAALSAVIGQTWAALGEIDSNGALEVVA